ncbi:UDP-3-O-(3-hydroxymyristoyl)glucosamine N-acyltransferase|uniref:UDP-3-O-(3-hydroxymyristoyl)glucosamine N-acyltransferase n=1 Tax=Noviherbaspirillum sp. L7-7A TaxID=2850560 RepID=UPI001C2CA65D|nr:UDP-3-O-(3-hydroxymyristoyl)glucosamine N-acyltransferase [Noviherbaspirillum sp. L7-7A]MBV0878558.1 UDP-3-O-(3-hydroxymyristoyl)glucosamine N-acyltransferase [Noviherbaspirillum sp. L7-7A]
MAIPLRQLVEQVGGQLQGDPDTLVSGIAPLDAAGASHVSFLSNPKLRSQAAASGAAALILTEGDSERIGSQYAGARILTERPYAYFARAAQLFAALSAPPVQPGIHPSAAIDPDAKVAASASIGPHVTVEAGAMIGERCIIGSGCVIGRNAVVGADTHFHPRVCFLAGCTIGERGIVHSGAVIGADGFGFANEGGAWIKIPQTGRVVIGNDVEIGANTTVDRGALADTVIEDGVKLDNQIQIGHNCHIGAHTAMAGCVGVAGSATIGKYCTFGGAAMILGHLTIADNVHISSGSLVSRSITEAGQYTGFYPLATNAEWEKSAAIVRNLSGMRGRMRELEKTVAALTSQNKNEQ